MYFVTRVIRGGGGGLELGGARDLVEVGVAVGDVGGNVVARVLFYETNVGVPFVSYNLIAREASNRDDHWLLLFNQNPLTSSPLPEKVFMK